MRGMLGWMAWTTPVAVLFGAIGALLIGMTLWELRSPSVTRRGFLPIATTRGDRLFIGVLAVAFSNLAFVAARPALVTVFGLSAAPSMWIGFALSLMLLLLIMRKG